jgi:hypothetical protein
MTDYQGARDYYKDGYSADSFEYYPIETPLTGYQPDEEFGSVAAARPLPGRQFWVPDRTTVDPVSRRMLLILLNVAFVGALMLAIKPAARIDHNPVKALPAEGNETDGTIQPIQAIGEAAGQSGAIAPLFTPEVQYWAAKILEWSHLYGVDPNMAATVMQIESCGDPQAVSRAGAMSLFQVMPFHFTAGEDGMDPETNARRGLNYFAERLVQTNGDVGRAFAGYNGGHVAAASSWGSWAHETQRYYVWSTGIYADAKAGLSESSTLQQWLAAGGASLCRQAASRLGI